ncbi:MAG: N-(5-phosphoribosyl)anthranilate isomerase [Gemmatimonadetes bacterium]|nr:N-(5-phosphoribosyl)anthranilate isomerase [Gemmatimonadota bacterium]
MSGAGEVRIKFCGLTRSDDAREAARLGASFVGVIFAGGPRAISAAQAAIVLAGLPATVYRVGVFGSQPPDVIAEMARVAGLDVVQLHADPTAEHVEAVRGATGLRVWAALRVNGLPLPDQAESLFDSADAVVLDAHSDSALGGTGVTLPWGEVAGALARFRSRRASLVLAGGLRAENVREGILLLSPDVVDVSSGVEFAPGLKDHSRMVAFRDAVLRDAKAARGEAR